MRFTTTLLALLICGAANAQTFNGSMATNGPTLEEIAAKRTNSASLNLTMDRLFISRVSYAGKPIHLLLLEDGAIITDTNACLLQWTLTKTNATNWTGIYVVGGELGYVVTNHIAEIAYDGEVHKLTLKTEFGNTAVLRTIQAITVTNSFWFNPGVLTNRYRDEMPLFHNSR